MKTVTVQIDLPNEECNYYTTPRPKMGHDAIYLTADNLSHGCGGACIVVSHDRPTDVFGAVVKEKCLLGVCCSKETLKEIISGLQLIYDNCDIDD